MKKPSLENVKILVVDGDIQISGIVKQSLKDLGFENCHYLRTYTDAVEFLQTQAIDLLITEWVLRPSDGLELVRHVRLGENSLNRGVPIIMLTARGEIADIQAARDAGITEFLIKPFTVKTLFDRIEHVVENPRWFVVSNSFVGPDRRRKRKAGASQDERRRRQPLPTSKQGRDIPNPSQSPMILPPDFELRRTMGLVGNLSDLITADMIEAAQRSIDAMQEESIQWIKEDLVASERAFIQIEAGDASEDNLDQLQMGVLSLKSRAGIFGYRAASDIAQLLYSFLRNSYDPHKTGHNPIVRQCIEALKIVLARNLKLQESMVTELIRELRQTMQRL